MVQRTVNEVDIHKYNLDNIRFLWCICFYNFSFQLGVVNICGTCEVDWQCGGAGICDQGLCTCRSGYTQIDGNCYPGKIFQVYHELFNMC